MGSEVFVVTEGEKGKTIPCERGGGAGEKVGGNREKGIGREIDVPEKRKAGGKCQLLGGRRRRCWRGWDGIRDKETVRPVTYPGEREDDANDLVLELPRIHLGRGGRWSLCRARLSPYQNTTTPRRKPLPSLLSVRSSSFRGT